MARAQPETLDIAESQVCIAFDGDPNFRWHHRVLLIYLLKLDEYRVVALARAAVFPPRVRGQVYAFGALSDADLANLRRDGRNFAKVLGFPLPAVQPGVEVPRWIVADPASDHFGEELSLELITSAERFISRDAVALVMLSDAEGWVAAESVQLSDEPDWKAEKRAGPGRGRRVLPQTGVSAHTVSLAQLAALLKSVDVEDWPLEGPKALVECLAAVVSPGHSVSSHWGFWVAQSGVSRGSAVAQELKNIARPGLGRLALDSKPGGPAPLAAAGSVPLCLGIRTGSADIAQESSVKDVLDNFDATVVRPLSELPEDEPLVQPHWDPQLDPRRRGTRPALAAFLRALAGRGLVGARARRKSCISASFVRKKNGDQRMALDARQANQLQRLPPKTVLASGEALAAINLVDATDLSPDDLDIVTTGGDLVAGSVDLLQMDAGELGVTQLYGEELGRYVDISPDTRVWPCFEALPMGWSWALWTCQEVLIDTMGTVFGDKDSWCLDKGKPPSLLNGGVAHAPYVDNANLISLGAGELDRRLGAVADELDKRGLRWHELQHATSSQGILGLEFDGRHGRLRHTSRRAWRLYLGPHKVVLRRPRLARWQVRRLLRHIVHYFSIMRPALSVLGESYAYLESGPMEGVSRLPSSVLTELRCAAGLVFLGQAELFGHEVLDASRWRERQRFSEVDVAGDPDKDVYLGRAAGLADVSDLCCDDLGVADAGRPRRQARARRRRQEMEVGRPAPELAPELVDPQRWAEAFRGAWRHPGRIHSLEARASAIGLGAAARQVNCHGAELLSLSDNLSSVLSFEKGRASNRELLAQCRRAGALQLGAEITWRVRHVPGCVNVACPPAPGRWSPVVGASGGPPCLGPAEPEPLITSVAFATRPSPSRVSRPPGLGEKPIECTGQCSEVVRVIDESRSPGWVIKLFGPPSGTRRASSMVLLRVFVSDPALVSFAARVLKICRKLNIFVLLENPGPSRVWRWAPLEKELRHHKPGKVVYDSCRFGAPFKKPGAVAGTLPGLELLGRQSAYGRATPRDLATWDGVLAATAGEVPAGARRKAAGRAAAAVTRADQQRQARRAPPGDFLRMASLRPATLTKYQQAVADFEDALAGWLAKTPRRPGMPAPLDAVIACVGALAERSSLGALAAVAMIVQFDLCLRPSESSLAHLCLCDAKCQQRCPPSAEAVQGQIRKLRENLPGAMTRSNSMANVPSLALADIYAAAKMSKKKPGVAKLRKKFARACCGAIKCGDDAAAACVNGDPGRTENGGRGGAAVLTGYGEILGEAIASQANIHEQWGGVVPRLAQEGHRNAIDKTVEEALRRAGVAPAELSAVAVTVGPGLGLCLEVGVRKALQIAAAHDLPLVRVHHMEAHTLVTRLPPAAAGQPAAEQPAKALSPAFPFVTLLVSGGHNMAVLSRGIGSHTILGSTIDDSIGEAFDKTARLLGITQVPGGPHLERLAKDTRAIPTCTPSPCRSQRRATPSCRRAATSPSRA
ncbi:unnamed protein product [Prorocentrum cordatum]|uniref:N(6)-L-threonylcarbamoyladenine synthase n=1 Tax=Prorocentrum cordatum TaxID=2364126 RepID=A0ABN9XAA5_9DINO|nr:unnamed protein product [Polarella glacialis]